MSMRFLHLQGVDTWNRCDHIKTDVHVDTASVRLLTLETEQTDRVGPERYRAWQRRRGGAARLACGPVQCPDGAVLVADERGLWWLAEDGWVQQVEPPPPVRPSGMAFLPKERSEIAGFSDLIGLSVDPAGRVWLLERGRGRVLLLDPHTMQLLDALPLPPPAQPDDIATGARLAVATDSVARRVWGQSYGGPWELLDLGAVGLGNYIPVAATNLAGDVAVLLRPDGRDPEARSQLLVLGETELTQVRVPSLEDPLHLLGLADGSLLIGEVPAREQPTARFHRFRISGGRLAEVDAYEVRGFDGRAIFADDGRLWATTKRGARPLYRVKQSRVEEGRIETFNLDSRDYGCTWHRLFIDVCLPGGSEIEVQARTSDDLYRRELARDPQPPGDMSQTEQERWARDELLLGSRRRDDNEGWVEVGVLDRRSPRADIPYPERHERPSEDPYPRTPAPGEDGVTRTLEGLLKNRPGRYLWLRVTLRGPPRHSPILYGLRVTYPRPSLLDHLPAFWRSDPEHALKMDHLLSLFEGSLTELDSRIDVLTWLLDPRVCPPEALEWLGSFIALTFDERLGEGVRRQLLLEMATLYKQRGTVAGIERLCKLLTGLRVQVIEAHRLRPPRTGHLGSRRDISLSSGASVIGPNLQLGPTPVHNGRDEVPDWEAELEAGYASHLAAWDRSEHACPPEKPDDPLEPSDEMRVFYRRFAHRFTVAVFGTATRGVQAAVHDAVDQFKPAHTVFGLCWLGTGFQLGVDSFVGLGTQLASADGIPPALLGGSSLGSSILNQPDNRAFGTRVGQARIGQGTTTG